MTDTKPALTATEAADEFDDVPVRLPSGSRAVVRLPRPFTSQDAAHLISFLSGYIEDALIAAPQPTGSTSDGD